MLKGRQRPTLFVDDAIGHIIQHHIYVPPTRYHHGYVVQSGPSTSQVCTVMTAICLLYITRYGTIRRYVCTTASSSFVSFGSLLWSCHELQQQYIIRTLTELQVRCWWSMTMTPAACIHGARSAPIHNMYMICSAYEHHLPVLYSSSSVYNMRCMRMGGRRDC